MTTRLAVLLVSASLLVLPAVAGAQDNPFTPIPQAQQPQQTQPQAPPPTTQQDTGSGISNTQLLLIALAGGALLFGIAVAIVRDARKAAPVTEHDLADPAKRHRATRPPPDQRISRNRAKARAARRARKKTKRK